MKKSPDSNPGFLEWSGAAGLFLGLLLGGAETSSINHRIPSI